MYTRQIAHVSHMSTCLINRTSSAFVLCWRRSSFRMKPKGKHVQYSTVARRAYRALQRYESCVSPPHARRYRVFYYSDFCRDHVTNQLPTTCPRTMAYCKRNRVSGPQIFTVDGVHTPSCSRPTSTRGRKVVRDVATLYLYQAWVHLPSMTTQHHPHLITTSSLLILSYYYCGSLVLLTFRSRSPEPSFSVNELRDPVGRPLDTFVS